VYFTPLAFNFFWCNNFVFSEVGEVSHFYLQYILRCLTTVPSTAAQGTNSHSRFTLRSQFPFSPAFLCALLLLRLPQIPTREHGGATALCDGAIHVDYMNVFNPQYIRFVDALSWTLRCIGGDSAMGDAIVMPTRCQLKIELTWRRDALHSTLLQPLQYHKTLWAVSHYHPIRFITFCSPVIAYLDLVAPCCTRSSSTVFKKIVP
jgi:hypothetical protein